MLHSFSKSKYRRLPINTPLIINAQFLINAPLRASSSNEFVICGIWHFDRISNTMYKSLDWRGDLTRDDDVNEVWLATSLIRFSERQWISINSRAGVQLRHHGPNGCPSMGSGEYCPIWWRSSTSHSDRSRDWSGVHWISYTFSHHSAG